MNYPAVVVGTTSASPWFSRWRSPGECATRLRLFCFPFAGGGATAYRGWNNHLPPGIEVCAVQLPGRESRWSERPIDDLSRLLESLEREILPLLDVPFAFFGTSMGAAVQLGLARRLAENHAIEPVRLFVAASHAPDRPRPGPLSEMVDGVLATRDRPLDPAVFRRFGVIPEAVLNEPDLLELLMPAFYADLQMVRRFSWPHTETLRCPITAFAGDADALVSEGDVAGWSRQTQGEFVLRTIPGDHLFIRTERERVCRAVLRDLEPVLDASQSRTPANEPAASPGDANEVRRLA